MAGSSRLDVYKRQAQKAEGYHSATATATYTKAKVFGMLKDILAKGKLRRYKANGTLMMYVSSAIMDALEPVSYTHLDVYKRQAGYRIAT